MNIGPYSFEAFKERATAFHGYPAPGLLLGGYMVAMAQRALPEGTLFEAVVETKKCLPDAVQLLTLCSAGNNWLKIVNLGKYAVSLFDKYSGEGFRTHVNLARLNDFPEIKAWLLKLKPKREQNTDKLLKEIENAGDTICAIAPIRIRSKFLGHSHMAAIGSCPRCKEAYPLEDGVICRGCQGEAPYSLLLEPENGQAPLIVPVEQAAGKKALHDMTQIIPGQFKDPAFKAGQTLSAGDVCRLQQMGRFNVAVENEAAPVSASGIHENKAAAQFAARMSGENVTFSLPPKEGKINLRATKRGMLCVDKKRLEAFNMTPDVMCASRQDGTIVEQDAEFAGTRIIPLFIHEDKHAEALAMLNKPLFSIAPLRKASAGILVTGTEVFKGLIKDRFLPIIEAKLQAYGCSIAKAEIAPDDKEHIKSAISAIKKAGADLLITTGGLSVDPDDVTRDSLLESGLTDALYGAPALPGTMTLTGRIPGQTQNPPAGNDNHAKPIRQPENGEMQVIGVPACALYYKITLFDILLPRLLAGRILSRPELAAMGEGGFCAQCKLCTWPKCFFAK